jgi:hypothetical protein
LFHSYIIAFGEGEALFNDFTEYVTFLGNGQDYSTNYLRWIFGPSKNMDGSWRIKTNEELNKLIKYKNIVNHIKAQRLGWFGHVY